MIADFNDRRLRWINGVEVKNFTQSETRWPIFFSSFRDPEVIPAQGTYIIEFIEEAGENGWEIVNFNQDTSWQTILFKREIEIKENKKNDKQY